MSLCVVALFCVNVAGAVYRMDVAATDAAGNTGPVASWRWSSASCMTDVASATVGSLTQYPVVIGERLFMWAAPPAVQALSGYQYSIDGGAWTLTTDTSVGVVQTCNLKGPRCGLGKGSWML